MFYLNNILIILHQGVNSAMMISLVNMTDTLELEQSSIQDTGSVFIRVKNNSKLNYEESHQLFFEVIAQNCIEIS